MTTKQDHVSNVLRCRAGITFFFGVSVFLYQNKNPVLQLEDWRQFCDSLRSADKRDLVVCGSFHFVLKLTNMECNKFHFKDLASISQFQYKMEVTTYEIYFDQYIWVSV
jgi:hypothetical protein